MAERRKIEILELLRFAAMTEVFLIHYMNDYINSEAGLGIIMVSGKLGVAFFFMITAYLLVTTTNPENKHFLGKKAIQLLPKYELILFVIFICSKVKPSVFRTFDVSNLNFFKSLLLIPYQTKGVPFCCPLLPVAWTLIVQVAVFIVFWLINILTKNSYITAGVLSVLLVIGTIFGHISSFSNLFTFTYCRYYMLYFVAGFVIAIIDNKTERIKQIEIKIPLWGAIIMVFLFLFASCFYDENPLCYGIAILVFAGCIFWGKTVAISKYVIFMGKISYSFFLIHYLLCKVFTRVISVSSNIFVILGLAIVCYFVTIFVSALYDKFVDYVVLSLKRIKKV